MVARTAVIGTTREDGFGEGYLPLDISSKALVLKLEIPKIAI